MPAWLEPFINSAITVGLIAVLLKFAVGSITKRLENIESREEARDKRITELQLDMAKLVGKKEGEDKMVWQKIDTGERKIAQLQASEKKSWEVLSKVAERLKILDKRTSDKLNDF